MGKIGLIGGMSWESTAVYYRRINELVRAARGGLRSADLLLRSLDFVDIIACQQAADWDGAAAILADAAEELARAGADCVLICTNTMHLVAAPVALRLAAVRPHARLIDIIDETAAALREAGRRRPLLLATRYTMEHDFYARRMRRHGIEVLVPEEADRAAVHAIIFDELCQGSVREASRARMLDIIARSLPAGADAVILGCTEICLLLDANALPCPGFDSTELHARAAVTHAFGVAPKDGVPKAAGPCPAPARDQRPLDPVALG